jgi:hypothetical protein
MRSLLVLGLVGLSFGAEACLGQEREAISLEQLETGRPQGEVTVAFRVGEVALRPIAAGQPPYQPIALDAAGRLRDVRNRLHAVLTGKALTQIHRLGINDPVKHFRGRIVAATGKVRYITLHQIGEDGKPNPGDPYTHYEMVIDRLDHLRVAPQVEAPLQSPKRILDGTDIGVLFPTFGDFDGDGKIDLLVGVEGLGRARARDEKYGKGGTGRGEGGLLVYKNRGTSAAPDYAKPFWFDDLVPNGRIPGG